MSTGLLVFALIAALVTGVLAWLVALVIGLVALVRLVITAWQAGQARAAAARRA